MNRNDALYNLESLSDAIQATKEALNIVDNFNETDCIKINAYLNKANFEVNKLFSELTPSQHH